MSNGSISRREILLTAGKTLAGFALLSRPVAGQKPSMFLPPADSMDPAVHSTADNLFWTQIMMEHAGFLALFLPGADLTSHRLKAEQLHQTFLAHLDRMRAQTIDRSNFAALNHSTADLIKPLIEFKQSLLDAQSSGKIHTLIWPTFLEHTIEEAHRAVARLTRLAGGDVTLHYAEVVEFWTGMMSDHAALIAHLLDPKEADLIATALDSSGLFKGYKANVQSKGLRGIEVLTAVEELIDFKTATAKGVEIGTIRSIMPPLLADHVRREALKFVDELKRTAYRT